MRMSPEPRGARVLLVEDSPDFQVLVRRTLSGEFDLTSVSTSAEALREVERRPYDLILLDVVLPDGDGFQLCSRFRGMESMSAVPIIFLTGKTGVTDKVTGFSLGADDYVVKPFEPLELLARVQAKLNRRPSKAAVEDQIVRGALRLDLPFQRASLSESGVEKALDLTPIEFKLLCYFARNEGRVLSRAQLLTAIWGESVYVLDRTIDKHVSTLRSKLGIASDCVETVPGSGYRFLTRQVNPSV